MDKIVEKTRPKVSVIMPVYNSALYLREAIDSILNQTFQEFEFIIIDDASTDYSIAIINSYQDTRIKLIEKPVNTGLTNSLNLGLNIAKGEYIARMDSDDISLPERLRKQVEFMDLNPEVGLCGTWIETFGYSNEIRRYSTDDNKIKVDLLAGPAFAHPSVMLRKAVLEKWNLEYNVESEPAEDYDLWVRLANYCQLANLPEVFLRYRVHEKQVTKLRTSLQHRNTMLIRTLLLAKLEIPSFSVEKEFIGLIFTADFVKNSYWVCKAHSLLAEMIEANKIKNIYNHSIFYQFIINYWQYFLNNLIEYDIKLLKLVFTSPFYHHTKLSAMDKIKFCAKCLLHQKINA